MKLLFCLAVLAALIFSCASAQSCTASLNQTRQASWVDAEQFPRSLWTVEIRNTGQQAVTNVLLSIQGSINQIWEVVLVNDSLYRLPDWRLQVGGIPAGQSHVFGFIVNNNSTAAPVSLVSVQCGNVTVPSPSPSASASSVPSPSASASAAPSPSAGASPSSSPRPSPSGGCSLLASQVARSGAGGSWSDNSNRFQIYDITLNNNGASRLTQASLTIAIAADQAIAQFWNLERVDATNTFNIESFLLPAPGGSQSGLGYVLQTPLNSTSDGSSIGAVNFRC